MNTTREKALSCVLRMLDCQYGPGTVKPAGELPPLEVVQTGLDGLDTALGVGGIPKGRIIEIYGSESSGKTTLALHLARRFQDPILYVDAEHGLPPAQADGLYLLDVDTLENTLSACMAAAEAFGVIVIDSLTALPTHADVAGDLGFEKRVSAAKVLSRALPQLIHVLHETGCTLILTTQLRERVGVMYGNPEKPAGGRALRHYASIRLDVRRIEAIKGKQTEIVGQRIRVKVEKNKLAPPLREASMELVFTPTPTLIDANCNRSSAHGEAVRMAV